MGGKTIGNMAGLSKRAALRAVLSRMHLYGHPCLCTRHCNYEQSWAFWTCSKAHLLCPPWHNINHCAQARPTMLCISLVISLFCYPLSLLYLIHGCSLVYILAYMILCLIYDHEMYKKTTLLLLKNVYYSIKTKNFHPHEFWNLKAWETSN